MLHWLMVKREIEVSDESLVVRYLMVCIQNLKLYDMREWRVDRPCVHLYIKNL